MTHVVTRSCCTDAACVHACPVNCIHPTPDEPDFGTTEMLYVDPSACVDCGACVGACPVGAIKPHTRLGDDELPFVDLAAAYHQLPRPRALQAPVPTTVRLARSGGLRVAVVGSGPAAVYLADELVKNPEVEVTLLEQHAEPFGLARWGVSPDHRRTRAVRSQLARICDHPRISLRTGVRVDDLADLRADHDAVVWAGGAAVPRRLDVPPGVTTPVVGAADLVAWWNGRPGAVVPEGIDAEHVTVVGAGNVALDVARVLTAPPERLADAELSDLVRARLAAVPRRHVTVLARGAAMTAACTTSELIGLAALRDRTVRATGVEDLGEPTGLPGHRATVLRRMAAAPEPTGDRSITLAFGRRPEADTWWSGLVVAAIGHRLPADVPLPVDPVTGAVAHEAGAVLGRPGVYVVGWAKRGATGFIGTNRACARETARTLLRDANRLAVVA